MATLYRKNSSNWESGKRGFQSVLNDCQQMGLLLIWSQNQWKNAVGRQFLESRYRIALPTRTLTAYKTRLKALWDRKLGTLDDPADWADFKALFNNGVPERHLNKLHGRWRDIQKICLDVGVTPIRPTYRALKWWAYVSEYYENSVLAPSDRQIIGDQFLVRELISERTQTAFINEDIEMWLIHQPWRGQTEMRKYLDLVAEKKIRPINWSRDGWGLEIADSLERTDQYPKDYGLSMLNWLLATSPEPYLLPSQIIERYSIFARP